jgi:4-hydroxyproline epimerase
VFFDGRARSGMCGHGTIGLVATLAHLGRLGPGRHRIDTPVGASRPRCTRTAASRSRTCRASATRATCASTCPGIGAVVGDVAWGGNWFYLVREHGLAIGSSTASR